MSPLELGGAYFAGDVLFGDFPGGTTPGDEEEAPPITQAGERLYDSIPSVFVKDPEVGWFGRYWCQAIMSMLQDLDGIVDDTPEGFIPVSGVASPGLRGHPGWTSLADPAVCPADWLPFCAQLYGVTLVPGQTVEQQRNQIKELPPQHRGGLAAMEKAAEVASAENGPGFKTTFFERDQGKAYHIFALTRPKQTPNEELHTLNAILTQKPAGITLTYISSSSPLWEQATKEWGKAKAGVEWSGVKPGDV